MFTLTNRQARQFLLLKQGLLGRHRFSGKAGALSFVRQAGCLQFDPIDICGKNAELVLKSRVRGFTKAMLDELLYQDRVLADYPDKNLAIILTEDWPYFERGREAGRRNGENYPQMQKLMEQVRRHLRENGAVSSDDLDLAQEGPMDWHSAIHWSSGNKAGRAVLEQMYSAGELIIHHKKGTRKYYDLAEKHLPAELLSAPEPLPDEFDHWTWRVQRRIGAVGLLWNRASDAWLNINGMKTGDRNEIFAGLLAREQIQAVKVEGIKDELYVQREDQPLMELVLQNQKEQGSDVFWPRCEFIAPLDNMMWDRKLIKAIFGFDYKWEIYTPVEKRKYGHYVLPILYGENFIGRLEAAVDRKNQILQVKHIWYEAGVRKTKKLEREIEKSLSGLADFNGCLLGQRQ